ncbi:proline-serine-threonine phosphatase-interacting protein 1b [Pholidichthys leucotaenia]
MAPLMFKDAFWGSDFTCHIGYDVMRQRLLDGRQMCKDMEELLKMRALAEEKYGKELVTISRKAGGHMEISTLRTSFDKLKTEIENIGNFHIHLSDILKDEVKKIEAFRERQKEQRKKFESIMEKLQKKKVLMFKKTMESKKNYELRCKEADEAENGAKKLNSMSKNSEKVRHKVKQCRQAASDAEKLYINSVIQLETVRHDWEETHKSTCEVFQQMEGDRISMLRCALWDHCNHFSMQCVKEDELYEEVRKRLEQCDINTDNDCFVKMKSTGSRPPEPIAFESYYQTGTVRDSDGTAQLPAEDSVPNSCSDPLLGSCETLDLDSPHNSRSALTSVGESEASDGEYAPLPGQDPDPPLAAALATEELYVVLYQFNAQLEEELSVSRGELVRVLETGEDGWWKVERDGLSGLVPGNYLDKV